MAEENKEIKLSNDPIERFYQLAELYVNGLNPVELGLIPGNPVTKKVIPPEKWKERQIKRAVAAADDWVAGIKSPSRDPIKAAIESEDKWADRLQTAIKEGRRKKALEKVTHADIVTVVDKLGTSVFTSGIEAREAKIGKRVAELQPLAQAVSDAIQSMPDKTDADREKRLLTARKLMLEVGKKRRGIA